MLEWAWFARTPEQKVPFLQWNRCIGRRESVRLNLFLLHLTRFEERP